MANIKQQKKRIRIAAEERLENLRYQSTIKTLTKRLTTTVATGDAATIEAFFARYRALAADQVDSRLQLAYESHRDALAELERAWPTLP